MERNIEAINLKIIMNKSGETKMEIVLEVVKTCVPIVIGALIAIIPTMIEKSSDRKHELVEKQGQQKQDMYVELISLFSKVLKNQNDNENISILRDRINLISITGSTDVVKALNEYIDTWGKASSEEQNEKYTNLLKVIRVDLKVDKKLNKDFPKIGLRDISIKNSGKNSF